LRGLIRMNPVMNPFA